MGTPRPRTRRLDDGRTITYYDQAYSDYLDAIQEELAKDNAINDNLCTSTKKSKTNQEIDENNSTRYRQPIKSCIGRHFQRIGSQR